MKVLEEFNCVLDKIDEDGVAYVTLKSESGEELWGEYPAAELAAHGVRERRRFKYRVVESDDNVISDEIEAIPDVELSRERIQQIHEKVERMLGDDDLPQSDY